MHDASDPMISSDHILDQLAQGCRLLAQSTSHAESNGLEKATEVTG